MADDKSDRYGLMTFTGPAGTRTYYDRDGVLQAAAQDEPREAYDPLTGAYLGLLIEQEATNYALNNQSFDGWSTNGMTLERADGAAGAATAARLTETADNTFHRLGYPWGATQSSGTWTLSAVVKGFGEPRNISLQCFNTKGVSTGGANFDLQTGVVNRKDGSTVDAGSVSFGESIRFFVTMTADSVSDKSNLQIELKKLSDTTTGFSSSPGETSTGMVVEAVQIEKSERPSSLIPTNGSPVTRQRDDARFTDSSVFNDFERGAFFLEFKQDFIGNDVSILSTPDKYRIVNIGGAGDVRTEVTSGGGNLFPKKPLGRIRYVLSWDSNKRSAYLEDKVSRASGSPGIGGGPLQLARGWSGTIKSLDFLPTQPTESEAQQFATLNARTVIGDCPSGGYYDYSDLSTLFVESDASGIPIADRTPARVGGPIGAILDVSGHENHMTASTDDRRGVLESDGVQYWIRSTEVTSYGFNLSGDYSITTLLAADFEQDTKVITLSANDNGGGSAWAGIYHADTSNSIIGASIGLSSPRYYFNGVFNPVAVRQDAIDGLTKPCTARVLYGIATDNLPSKAYLFGYEGYGLNGKSYGFAWASRLSEDDALIVEDDMRRNMPAIPA